MTVGRILFVAQPGGRIARISQARNQLQSADCGDIRRLSCRSIQLMPTGSPRRHLGRAILYHLPDSCHASTHKWVDRTLSHQAHTLKEDKRRCAHAKGEALAGGTFRPEMDQVQHLP
eukprot:scaffold4883_cov119-Isochrysis_galbana.AAC.5